MQIVSFPPVDGPKDPWPRILSLPGWFVGDPASLACNNISTMFISLVWVWLTCILQWLNKPFWFLFWFSACMSHHWSLIDRFKTKTSTVHCPWESDIQSYPIESCSNHRFHTGRPCTYCTSRLIVSQAGGLKCPGSVTGDNLANSSWVESPESITCRKRGLPARMTY